MIAHRIYAISVLALFLPMSAGAHHILGIPHYAYDEQYPQAPVLTYRIAAGANEVKMTGYPGIPQPGERCTLHVYIYDAKTKTPFVGRVKMTVLQDQFLGSGTIIYGPMTAELDEGLYKFHPEFQQVANYIVRIEFEAEAAPWIVDLPMVVGEPGSPWVVVGSVAAAVILFLTVIRAIRIKIKRRLAPSPPAPASSLCQQPNERSS